jgi:hypothetical protein
MGKTSLICSITFSQSGDKTISHDDFKRVTNLVIEQWSEEGDHGRKNAKPDQINNPWNYVDLNRPSIAARMLRYDSMVVGDDLVIEFNLNEVLENPVNIKADYWEDKYLQNYNDDEKMFHPLVDDFFNNFGGKLTFIFFKEMSASKDFKDLPILESKLFNRSVSVV